MIELDYRERSQIDTAATAGKILQKTIVDEKVMALEDESDVTLEFLNRIEGHVNLMAQALVLVNKKLK